MDPDIKRIVPRQWTLIATKVLNATLHRKTPGFDYYITYRETGNPSPDSISCECVPAEAVPLFEKSGTEEKTHATPIDIYVWVVNTGSESPTATIVVDV